MASLNTITLIGRVVAPPEMRYTPGGKAVAQFALAVDRRASKNTQEKECDFIPIVVWEKLAEVCNQYLTKGKQIAIQGQLRTRSYETQDGQKRKAFEVVANEMQMLGGKTDGEQGGGQGQRVNNQAGMTRNGENPRPAAVSGWGSDSGFGADDLSVDEIPF